MKKRLAAALASAAIGCLASPLAQSATYQFNADLSGGQENPPTSATATGIATLHYDTHDTASLLDDTYSFAMSVFGLSGTATGYHIHGAASSSENAPVAVSLAAFPFVSLNSGGTLLVGGSSIAAPAIPATPATATNAGYPAMSFLDLLMNELAYVNVHTAINPGGELRGQLIHVASVPEPGNYAMLMAGLGMLGFLTHRRRRP